MQIIGKGFSIAEFKTYIDSVTMTAWKPKFPVVHNTSSPDQKLYKQWMDTKHVTGEQWMKNLASYYSGMGWQGGPHLFVAFDKIWVLNPLTSRGTHTPSWNAISWGIETVAEFDREPFDGGVKDNLIAAVAILCHKMDFDPADFVLGKSGIHFHKEDKATTHKSCPGKNLVKHDFINSVVEYMNESFDSKLEVAISHPHISEASQTADTATLTDEELTSMKWVQSQLNRIGSKLTVDGIVGSKTKIAVKAFQQKSWLTADGIAGPLTRKALKIAK
jgi:hypothetical protein